MPLAGVSIKLITPNFLAKPWPNCSLPQVWHGSKGGVAQTSLRNAFLL
jgi:hypothetical protein